MATTNRTLSKPTLLDDTRDRIAQWRKTRPHGNTPMPAALWTAAVAAARRHGLYLTARSLRVDYGALKAHVEASGRGTSTPTFVELTPANGLTAGESIGCVIEVEGRKGTRRIRLSGLSPNDVVAMARMAWDTDTR